MLVNTFVTQNFDNCSLLWKFSNVKQNRKITKKSFTLLLKRDESTYEDLLKKFGYPDMNLKKQRTMCIDVYKTLATVRKYGIPYPTT